MPSLCTRITLMVLAAVCAATLGFNLGPRPADVSASMASTQYQQEEAAHLARLQAQLAH